MIEDVLLKLKYLNINTDLILSFTTDFEGEQKSHEILKDAGFDEIKMEQQFAMYDNRPMLCGIYNITAIKKFKGFEQDSFIPKLGSVDRWEAIHLVILNGTDSL